MNQRADRSRRPSTQTTDTFEWTPYTPSGANLRVGHTSCCGRYELASEGGQYVVLRRAADGYEETRRGRYRAAVTVYVALVAEHREEHRSRGEEPEYDALLDGARAVHGISQLPARPVDSEDSPGQREPRRTDPSVMPRPDEQQGDHL
ncbi:hypothetical protein GCM10020216_084450 [Nonomuraea helvata]